MKKVKTERSIYTTELIKTLEKVLEGDIISYEKLSEIIGINVKDKENGGYAYQKSARDILERDYNIVFEVIPNHGLKRLFPEQIARGSGNIYLKQKRGIVRRAMRRISTINDNYESLSKESQIKVDIHRTILAFDSELVKKNNIKKIESKVSENQKLLGFSDTLGLFK